MEQIFYFRRLHVKSDQRWSEKRKWLTRNAFLEDLNRWNRSGGGEFVYWEIAEETYNAEHPDGK